MAHLAANPHQSASTSFPWEHPTWADLPEHLKEQLFHAHCFSLTIHGAALLYNLMLAEQSRQKSGADPHNLVDDYRDELAAWAGKVTQSEVGFNQWDWQERFWQIVEGGHSRIPLRTRQFVNSWLRLALDKPGAIDGQPAARTTRGYLDFQRPGWRQHYTRHAGGFRC